MDMREASAMTEASGLTKDRDAIEGASGASQSAESPTSEARQPLDSSPRDAPLPFSDQLRRLTVNAPLQSLVVAFLLGVWVARRC